MAKKIKHTVKTYPKIDSKQIAKMLGTDSITGPVKVDEVGRGYFEFEVIAKDVHQTKKIYKLSNDEVGKYKLIGEAEGQFFIHCLFMGRHAENFHNRVYGYRILKPTRKDMKMRVAFYEKE